MALLVKNLTRRGSAPRAPFAKAAEAVLPGWELSLVFVGEARAKALNQRLRSKTYVPNVLSYQAGPKSGEVIICLAVAAKQAPAYNLAPTAYTLYLFIHGLLHLKGARHGVTMERRERALVARLYASPRAARTTRSPLTHGPTHYKALPIRRPRNKS